MVDGVDDLHGELAGDVVTERRVLRGDEDLEIGWQLHPDTWGNGMHWVGETTKYFDTDLQVFRLRMADLNRTAPEGHHPPNLNH